ncbi:MAG: prolyl oligopeptidase family serine peptidase, partial [Gammaproteobacteria bacterium]
DTGKFESRYGDTLIGPLPESMVDWKERSPLYSANKLACPVIFFQGLKDEIVKPDQAKRMVDALKKKKLPVAYLTFKDEAHGFRSADAIKQCIEAELVFYGRVLGFKPAGRLASLDIENLKH